MHQQAATKPLDSFPAIRSQSIEEAACALQAIYGARKLSLHGGREAFYARANYWQSGAISISYCSYGTNVQVDFPGANFFRQQFCGRGGAEIKVGNLRRQVTADALCVVPAGLELEIGCPPGFEQIVFRVDSDALVRKLEAMIGLATRRGLVFDSVTRGDSPAMEMLRRRLMFFASELDTEDFRKSPVAVAEMEQLLIVSFLRANPSNYSDRIDAPARSPASWQIHRVEEYIEAHWDEPITIEDLSRSTSLSARTIFHHFKITRGQSPMEFVKQVRLRHARQLLEEPDSQSTVTDVAFSCGFGNLSHFAKDYFRRYGERPSETLQRSRRFFCESRSA